MADLAYRRKMMAHNDERLITAPEEGAPRESPDWQVKWGSEERTRAMMRELGVVPLRDIREEGVYWIVVESLQWSRAAQGAPVLARWRNDLRCWRVFDSDELLDEHEARAIEYVPQPQEKVLCHT